MIRDREPVFNGRLAFSVWLFAFVVSAIAVVLSVQYVDRPLAEFLEAHVRHTAFWTFLDHALIPFPLVVILALFFLFFAGCWMLSGFPLRAWVAKAALCSWTVIWAVAVEFMLKQIFGLAWPDPTYIQNHFYGFKFLHGSEHWSSFPSGTATISTALAAAVWIVLPHLRVVSTMVAATLCAAVVVGNYHWLSDVIAGAFLGTSVGWMSAVLIRSDLADLRITDG